MPERVAFYIDGFNVYHSISSLGKGLLWLNYIALAEGYLRSDQELAEVNYFTALATWLPDARKRHEVFIRANRAVGVKTVLGRFSQKHKRCPLCSGSFPTHEEKKTDVNIALSLYRGAVRDEYDTAILVSAYSDFIPALQAVKDDFPDKKVGVLIPVNARYTNQLKREAHRYFHMKKKDLKAAQFPDTVALPDGKILRRPDNWK